MAKMSKNNFFEVLLVWGGEARRHGGLHRIVYFTGIIEL